MGQTKDVGSEIVRAYDERQRRLKEIKSQTSQLLKGATELLQGLRDDLSQARDVWRKAVSTLQARKKQKKSSRRA
jgi:hypothetical protein